ncbi:MAG: glycosyltransferase family 4 protein, partial [Bacteroidota bacterium]
VKTYSEEVEQKANTLFESENVDIRTFKFPVLDFLPGHYLRENLRLSEQFYSTIAERMNEYDLIYAQGFTGYEFIKRNLRIPVFINFHGYEMFQKAIGIKSKAEQHLFRNRVKWMSRKADFVFSFGAKIQDILNRIDVPSEKQIELPLGISQDWLQESVIPTKEKRKFIFIGRNERRKGINEINKALEKLIEESYDFEMHFIGPIPSSFQIPNASIIYHGQINDEVGLKNTLRACDILISASFSEGMPTVILEGMSQGLAVIATDVGAVSKMVDDTNGLCIESGNVIALYEAMKGFIQMAPESIDQLKLNSLTKFEKNFISEQIINKLILIFKEKTQEYASIAGNIN